MFKWAIVFFIVAVGAAFLGFGEVSGTAAWIGKIVLIVAVILFILSLIFGRRK
ncbi:protein of unknown function DUF1328 [Elusimicrobium minutum Pei191]|uniref:Uncharacterized protein n=1 Tax=Elusimicrobium minutum (strain Pei191) TaxID=445932 RepID=B2KDE8_ELUMP|nr:DUF1328 domain-containing protein [Elusimicrobium minutum]ACC98544.1 protein of unknown function DUF1328 [Elusimicrobium minutum Pei191]